MSDLFKQRLPIFGRGAGVVRERLLNVVVFEE
jgi:hypothetical protein